MVELNVYS